MANIVLRLSGGAANTNPAAALGGAMSTHADGDILTSNTTLNNLFDNISKAENIANTIDYRCVYIHNDTVTVGDLFASGAVYRSGTSLATFAIGLDPAGNGGTATTIVNENTAPAGVTFSAPTVGAPLSLGTTLDENEKIAIWIRRTANNITGSGTVTDSLSLVVTGTE